MQRKTKIIAAAAAASLLTLGGLAGLASAGMGYGERMMCGKGAGCRGGMGRGYGMLGQQMMERYDANKDGKVTQAEIDQNRQQWLAEFDADKNGTLSLEEFKLLFLKSRNQMMMRAFQVLDKDGNGMVTIEEYQAPMSKMVAQRDANNDGVIGPEDRQMKRQQKGEGYRWGHGMGPGMGQGRGYGEGQGWCGSADEPEDAKPADQQAPAEGQPTP
jgi:Ca2+-binding EF-hand superfamily protein